MAQATSELTWLVRLLQELVVGSILLVSLHCDNRLTIQIAQNLVFNKRTKHVEIDCHFTCGKVMDDLIDLCFTPSSEQLVVVLTKVLASPKAY